MKRDLGLSDCKEPQRTRSTTERAFAASGVLAQGIAPGELPVVVLAMPSSAEGLKAAEGYRGALASTFTNAIFIEVASAGLSVRRARGENVADIRADL